MKLLPSLVTASLTMDSQWTTSEISTVLPGVTFNQVVPVALPQHHLLTTFNSALYLHYFASTLVVLVIFSHLATTPSLQLDDKPGTYANMVQKIKTKTKTLCF